MLYETIWALIGERAPCGRDGQVGTERRRGAVKVQRIHGLVGVLQLTPRFFAQLTRLGHRLSFRLPLTRRFLRGQSRLVARFAAFLHLRLCRQRLFGIVRPRLFPFRIGILLVVAKPTARQFTTRNKRFFSNLIFLTPKEQVFSSGLFLASPTLSSISGLHGLSSSKLRTNVCNLGACCAHFDPDKELCERRKVQSREHFYLLCPLYAASCTALLSVAQLSL